MARDIRQRITVEIETRLRDNYTPGIMKTAMQAMQKETVRVFQDRTIAGYGADGNKLRRLKSSTIRTKERRLRGRRRPRGRFAATDPRQVARMTGQTLRDMQATGVRASRSSKGVSGGFQVTFKTARSREVAGRLEEQGRPIVGFCPPGSARGRRERARVLRVGMAVLQGSSRIKGTINDRPA